MGDLSQPCRLDISVVWLVQTAYQVMGEFGAIVSAKRQCGRPEIVRTHV
jgi:hypothetical protein